LTSETRTIRKCSHVHRIKTTFLIVPVRHGAYLMWESRWKSNSCL